MHTTNDLNPNSRIRTWTDGLLLGIIAAQPALDSLTYWLMTSGRTNWAAYLRAAALGAFGLLALLQERKIARWVLSVLWGCYVLSKYVLADWLLPGSGFAETSNMFRTMITPMFTLWLLWHVQADPRRGVRTITRGLLAAAVILTALAAMSLITGTYEITYKYQLLENMPEEHIGFSSWIYSPNAQSIVLAVLLGISAPVLARLRRPWALLGILAAFFLMMYFHGTRTAYYAMLLVGASLVGALAVQLLRKPKPRWWALGAAVLFLVLGIMLKPLSPLAIVDKSREMIRNIAGYLQIESTMPTAESPAPQITPEVQPTATLEVPTTVTPTAEETPATEPSPSTPTPPEQMARWDAEFRDLASMFYFSQGARNGLYSLRERSSLDAQRVDAAAYEYMRERMALPPAKLVDMRLSHWLYVAATLRHADALRLLTGYGVTWYTDVLGSVENDYAALVGYFGLLGCAVFFGVLAWALWRILRTVCIASPASGQLKRQAASGDAGLSAIQALGVRWRHIGRYFTPDILMAVVTVAMMIGLAAYSGRVFQQGSVSIYLSLTLGLLYCHVRLAGEEEDKTPPAPDQHAGE